MHGWGLINPNHASLAEENPENIDVSGRPGPRPLMPSFDDKIS
jgi:hypothetical protein